MVSSADLFFHAETFASKSSISVNLACGFFLISPLKHYLCRLAQNPSQTFENQRFVTYIFRPFLSNLVRSVKRVQILAAPAPLPNDHVVILADKNRLEPLESLLSPSEFLFLRSAVAREAHNFFFPQGEGSIFVRLLKPEKEPAMALETQRLAGNELLRELRQLKIESVFLRNCCAENPALAFAEGLALGSYQFLKYFTQPEKKAKPLHEIRVDSALATEIEIKELNSIVEATFLARDLVNEPYSHQSAEQLANALEEAGALAGFNVEVLGLDKIETLKMGGLIAVNKGSQAPPQFCILEWKPANAHNTRPVVLIGKGVVFDTGGLSLKPTEGMDYMKCDMGGAAAVAGVLSVAARTGLPVHLIGLIPATDNLIGAGAFAPGDVITMYSGKTVEVMNTDAEGRLILADALHYAQKYNPELVMDFATLTGAAVRALGSQAICYMGTASAEVKKDLETSGWLTYERLVELPLWKEYGDELKSNIADLKNLGSGNAGMITAGKFLEHFTGDYPWLHLDIAGPAYLRTASGYRTKEGTGVCVRLMYDFLKKHYPDKKMVNKEG